MAAPFIPQDGDVVIRRDAGNDKPVFVLHTHPGPEQFATDSREDAIVHAIAVARKHGARVWLTNGNHDFNLFEDFGATSASV